jgi:hypothetical protein
MQCQCRHNRTNMLHKQACCTARLSTVLMLTRQAWSLQEIEHTHRGTYTEAHSEGSRKAHQHTSAQVGQGAPRQLLHQVSEAGSQAPQLPIIQHGREAELHTAWSSGACSSRGEQQTGGSEAELSQLPVSLLCFGRVKPERCRESCVLSAARKAGWGPGACSDQKRR